MYCRNLKQIIYNKNIDTMIKATERNNERIRNISVSIPTPELDKISFHQLFTSAITSNEIEGISVNDTNSAIVNELNQTFINNYRNALEYIMNNYKTLELNEKEILANHRTLFANTNFPFGGKWKTSSNNVVDANTRNIISKTASPEQTPSTIGELVYWYEHEASIPSIIKVCIFIYDFLKIHPFEDGNGRTSRLLTNLLFLKNGCEFLKYSSLEEQINKYVHEYYDALRTNYIEQWFDNEIDYTKWIEFSLTTILRSQEKFLDMANQKTILDQISNKSIKVAKWFELNNNHQYSKKELVVILSLYNISSDTIKKVLPRLVEHNFISKIGTTNGVSYIRTLENQTKSQFLDIVPILNPGASKK